MSGWRKFWKTGLPGTAKSPKSGRQTVAEEKPFQRRCNEPIFEADLDESAYGYRPGRGGADAINGYNLREFGGYLGNVNLIVLSLSALWRTHLGNLSSRRGE